MSQLTVACIQMRSGTDVPANVEVASRLVREAAAAGATFVATPEMTSLLDRRPGKLLEQARAEEDDIALPAFRALAAELGITLLVGSLAVRVLPEQSTRRAGSGPGTTRCTCSTWTSGPARSTGSRSASWRVSAPALSPSTAGGSA
jgi:predicted amidohydrolase